MKKLFGLVILAVFVTVFIVAPAPAQAQDWKAFGSGEGMTVTFTELNMGNFSHGGRFMDAAQAGAATLELRGVEHNPDRVKMTGEFGYNTGYNQSRSGPGFTQESWGGQYGNVSGVIDSAAGQGHR